MNIETYFKTHRHKIALYLFSGLICLIFCFLSIHMLSNSLNAEYVLRVTSFKTLYIIASLFVASLLTTIFFISEIKIENKFRTIYLSIIAASVCLMIVLGYFTHGESIRSLIHSNPDDALMDFFHSIQYGMKPYTKGVIYPPLINVFYAFLGRFILDKSNVFLLRTNQLAILAYLFYQMGSYIFFFSSLKKYAGTNNMSNASMYLLGILSLFTVPFLFLMERGNSFLLVIPCLIYYCCFYDSNNLKKRSLAMLLLGVAASIKITPAVFGFLYIRDRNWKNGCIALIVGLLIFNIPFILTDGNLKILIENINNATSLFQGISFNNYGNPINMGYGCYVNLLNTVKFYSVVANIDTDFIAKYINSFMLMASVYIVTAKQKVDKWKVYTLLCGIIVLTPGFSAIYNLTLYLIPLVLFLQSNPKMTKMNCLYLFLFILIFIPVVNFKIPLLEKYFGHDVYRLTLSTLLEGTSALLLSTLILFETGLSNIFAKREKSLGILGITLFCLFGYYQYNSEAALKCFYPYQRDCGRSLQGVTLVNGKYSYFTNDASIKLLSKDVLENGLIINYDIDEDNDNCLNSGVLKIFINDQILASKSISYKKNQAIFISPEEIRKIYKLNSKSMSIALKAETFNGKVYLNYIGPVKPLESIKPNQYYVPSAIGLEKKPNPMNIIVPEIQLKSTKSVKSKQHSILLDNNLLCLKDERISEYGLMFMLHLPMEIVDAAKETIQVSLFANNKFIGKYDVNTDGICSVIVSPNDFGRNGIDLRNTLYVSFKSTNVYSERDLGISLNKEKQIGSIEYVGAPFNNVNDGVMIYDATKGVYTGLVFISNNKNIENLVSEQGEEIPVKKISNDYSYCYIPKEKMIGKSEFIKFKFVPKITKHTNFIVESLDLKTPNITLLTPPGYNGLFSYKEKQYINSTFRYFATMKIKRDGINLILDVPSEYNNHNIEVWYANKFIGNYVLKTGNNYIKISANKFSDIISKNLLNMLEFRTNISFNLNYSNGVEVISVK